MIPIENYPIEFEFLPVELIIFFSETNEGQGGKRVARTIREFCEYYKNKYSTIELPQPRIVSILCDKLVINNRLSSFNKGGFDNMENSYLGLLNDTRFITEPILLKLRNIQLSFELYGFKYIYEYYKNYTLPIIHVDKKNDISIGSSVLFRGGIITAKHCIEGAIQISIKGISPDKLKTAKFYILNKLKMDLIYIKFEEEIIDSIYFNEQAKILDEVIALGFPKIAGFHNFLTAERALVSSRFTATKGSVTAIAEDIWIRENLILITAKIKGGNSGGPIINDKGNIIGIATSLPNGEGEYDELGYGTVIPIEFTNEIIDNPTTEFDVSKIEFTAFVE